MGLRVFSSESYSKYGCVAASALLFERSEFKAFSICFDDEREKKSTALDFFVSFFIKEKRKKKVKR